MRMAEYRQSLSNLETYIANHPISTEVADASREYLMHGMHVAAGDSLSLVDSLPVSIRLRIREERFSDAFATQALLRGVSRGLLLQCIARAREDVFVAGLEILRVDDVPDRSPPPTTAI